MKNRNHQVNWIISGLFYGLFMFLALDIAYPLLEENPLSARKLLISLFIWLAVGLAYGYSVHLTDKRKGTEHV